MNRDRLYELLSAYINEEISEGELDELILYVKESEMDPELHRVIDEIWEEFEVDENMPVASDLVYQKIISNRRFEAARPVAEIISKARLWNFVGFIRVASVAAIFCLVLSLVFYKNFMSPLSSDQQTIMPGSKKAILTLNNGKVVELDDTSMGIIADENGTIIKKNSDGGLTYDIAGLEQSNDGIESLLMNNITTPKGGEYQVTLPDGTKVWLNAASSLTFPAKFSDETRVVTLVGEAYFEVASKVRSGINKTSSRVPFVVNTNDQRINVLGTKFNVKAYRDDHYSNTALIEGKVQISIPGTNSQAQATAVKILVPGEKATIQRGDKNINVEPFLQDEILAWKNGYFYFDNENIKSVMTTIARWYNVEVTYQGNPETVYFDGTISRFDSIEKLLKTISLTGSVKFKLHERRLTVMI